MCDRPRPLPTRNRLTRLAAATTLTLFALLQGSSIAASSEVTLTDDFDRRNSTDLSNGWAASTGDLNITSNALRNKALPGTHIATLPQLSGDIMRFTADFTFADTGDGSRLGVILRYTDPYNYYALYRETGSSNGVYISRVLNGNPTVLAGRRFITQATPGASFRITAVADGTTLWLHYTGGSVIAHDAHLATGSLGILIHAATDAQHSVDNVEAAVTPAAVTLSSPWLAIKPTDINPNHLASFLPGGPYYFIDSPITTFTDATTRYWYNSHPQSQSKFTGTLEIPYRKLIFNKDDLNPKQRFISDPTGARGLFWLVNLYRDPGGLLAFIHIELPPTSSLNYAAAKGRVGLAWSTDNGDTFTYLGHVIIPENDPHATNVQGVPYLIKEGYFYIYFTEECEAHGDHAVARAPVADVIAAAKAGTLSPWKKYHNGGWNSDGLGGPCSPLKTLGAINHTDAAYSTHTGKYYLLTSRLNWYDEDTWIKLYESTDALNWHHIKTIVRQPASSVLSGYQYVSIVDASGSDNGVVGKKFYIYSVKDPQYLYPAVSVLRWLVDLSGQPGTFTFASDFTSEQGGNQWSYQARVGTAYVDMTYRGAPWDRLHKLWSGDDTNLFIDRGRVSPGPNADVAIKWTAPQAGTVAVTGAVKDVQGGCGDGVIAMIFKNRDEIWRFKVADNDLIGKDPALSLSVIGGDAIYFVVNKGRNNYCDATAWNPTVTYTAVRPDAPMCFVTVDKKWAAAGQTLAVAWSSNGADSAQWSTGQVEKVAGGKTISNLTISQTFSLTVTGAGGQATCSASVSVAPAPISVPPETARLSSGAKVKCNS